MITRVAVWIARLIVGATFIVSGMTKMIDLYGSVNKFNDYFTAWGIGGVFPEGLIVMAAAGLSMAEFLTGFTLLTGSMRRTSAVCATAIMAFMLPLSAYIWAASPVSDCGCFGDWLIISNKATFLKNVVLMGLCIFLLLKNRLAEWLFAPWIQWVEIAVAAAYCALIGMVGYDVQPLLDFRPYPVGTDLADENDGDLDQIYVYRSKTDGKLIEYGIYDLPDDDSNLEFIEVRAASAPEKVNNFAILDPETGEDITGEVVGADPEQLFLLIPDLEAAGVAMSYNANELASRTSLIALTDASAEQIEDWRDISMADYPIYRADERTLKTVARGHTALVMTREGKIVWKRTLQSVDINVPDLDVYASPSGKDRFRTYTLTFVIIEGVIMLLGLLPSQLGRLGRRRRFIR